MSEPILSAEKLTKIFQSNDGNNVIACKDISLDLFPGETLGIVGESGSGKSTFARLVMKLYKPTSGKIIFHGQDITFTKGKELRKERKSIQMVYQDPSRAFNPKMKVKDIICEPLENFGLIKKENKEQKAKELLRLVELPEEFMDRYPHSLSGGQRQRVGVARAIALDPEIIILDEATSALDVSVQKNLLETIVELQQKLNLSIIFICHDIALVRQFADRTAVFYLGEVVEIVSSEDIPDNVKNDYTKSLVDSFFDLDDENLGKVKDCKYEKRSK